MHNAKLTLSALITSLLIATGAMAAETVPAPVEAIPAVAATAPAAEPSASAPVAAPSVEVAASAPAATEVAVVPVVKETVLSDADALALIKKSKCIVCHTIEKKIIGPAYRDVAAKYRGQSDMDAKLLSKITKGGTGVWGKMVMPPQTAPQDDIKALIKYILALK